jgi:hypothetical protein
MNSSQYENTKRGVEYKKSKKSKYINKNQPQRFSVETVKQIEDLKESMFHVVLDLTSNKKYTYQNKHLINTMSIE